MFGTLERFGYENASVMDEKRLHSIIDYTLLKPTATYVDIEKLCNIAHKNKYFSVCINPVNVRFAKSYLDERLKSKVKVCTVVGFPLGESLTQTKVFEAKRAIADGADEIDMVMCLSRTKAGDWGYVKNDISRVVRVAKSKVVKVIIESSLLTRDEIEKATKVCLRAKVDFVKTSTGFAGGGATPEAVEIIAGITRGKCGIKASGGIATVYDAMNLVRMGATRIGTSRTL